MKCDTGLACEECGADGEGGQIEYSDGRLCHFRKIPKDGKVYPLMCSGKLVPTSKTSRRLYTLAEVRERERAAWADGYYEGYGKGVLDAEEHHIYYVATQRWAEAEALRRYKEA